MMRKFYLVIMLLSLLYYPINLGELVKERACVSNSFKINTREVSKSDEQNLPVVADGQILF